MADRVVEVTLLEGLRAEGRAGQHVVSYDEPAEAGGTDAGMTPTQALLGALGACAAITMRMYAERKGWPLGGADVTVRLHRPAAGEKAPPRIVQEIRLVGDLDEGQRARLLEIAGRCPVHRLVDGPLETEERLA